MNCCSDRILVPSEFSKLRFWRNTNVAALPPGENYVTPMQTLGYEWDEDVDNGWRPDGMVRLSSTTVNVDQKAAGVGIKVFPGVATHALTLYRHPSGALVFGAGTVHWSYGLDSAHDELPTPPDRAMQQATVNLFADMGIQPLTLQNGADNQPLHRAEKSSDTDPPTATITFPSPGSTVPSGSRVTITGSAIDLGGVVAGVEISVDEGLTWHAALMPSPTAFSYAWQVGAIGQATIRARAIDDSGNLDRNGSATIVEVGAPICPCTSLWPASATPAVPSALDPAAVELGLKFTSDVTGFITGVRFYKGPANTGTHTGSLWTAAGERMASATFVEESATGWQQVLFPAPVAITANTVYVVSYHTTSGGYAADGGYLSATGVDAPPLHALPNAAAAGNGVFSYSLTPTFPDELVERHQLLGGRGVLAERDRYDASGDHRDQVDDRRQLAGEHHVDDQRTVDVEDPVCDGSVVADGYLRAAAGDGDDQPAGVRAESCDQRVRPVAEHHLLLSCRLGRSLGQCRRRGCAELHASRTDAAGHVVG